MTNSSIRAFSKKLIPISAYPTTIFLGYFSFYFFQNVGIHVTISAYLAISLAALLITVHELILPYRGTWKPKFGEIKSDILFLILVQVGLPFLLAASIVVYAAENLKTGGWALENIWPHEWPLAFQVVLMLILAEFPRYWLHRSFHKFSAMWQFHAVHHSPHKLYWLNVGRFHPVDKAAQFLFDALPFALVGLAPEVLAAYLVFYAINGFYQHSNCLLHLGWLNYLISGPELHRWHHSIKASESDHNFGNNLIIFDLIFGTRYLPNDRQVGALGLINRDYPRGFLPQMKTPFDYGLDKRK